MAADTSTIWISAISAGSAAVSALAAWGAIYFGAKKATSELSKWRDERRETKRAEVAGEVLVSTLRFLNMMEVATRGYVPPSPRPTDRNAVHASLKARWPDSVEISSAFVRAWELAETYLPSECVVQFQKVWDLLGTHRFLQHVFSEKITIDPHGLDDEKRKAHELELEDLRAAAFGAKPLKDLDDLREAVCKQLRPIVHLRYVDDGDA